MTVNQYRVFIKNLTMWYPDLRFSSLQSYEKCLLLKPPSYGIVV